MMQAIVVCAAAIFLSSPNMALSAPPGPEDDKNVSGTWVVHSPVGVRLYQIQENRNLKIVGGGLKDKTGKLRPQDDGSYFVDADGSIMRLIHDQGKDELTVEVYLNKKDIERKLSPTLEGKLQKGIGRKEVTFAPHTDSPPIFTHENANSSCSVPCLHQAKLR